MPTTIVGTIKNLDTTNPAASSFVRFWLRGCRGNTPRITGTGAIAPQAAGNNFYVDVAANSSGVVSGTIYSTRAADGVSNGEIEVGGSYTAVYYGMVIYNAGIPGPEVPVHAKISGSLDISSVTPVSTKPVIASPTGDTTYARLDGGNLPFIGVISSSTGFLQGTPTVGRVLRADGAKFIAAQLAAADLSDTITGSGNLVKATSPTLVTPVIASIVNTGTLTLPTSTDTLVGRATTDTLTNKTLTSPAVTNLTDTGTSSVKRVRSNQGSSVVSGDFSISGSWGSTASIASVGGTDTAGTISIASSGTGQGANPTFTLTFHDGAFPSVPIIMATRGDIQTTGVIAPTSISTTAVTFTVNHTPSAGQTYIFFWWVVAR